MPLEYYERSQIKFYGQRIMPPSCAQSNEQSPAPPKDESSKPIADSGSMPRLSTTMPSKIEWKGVMTRGKIVLPSYSQDEKGRKEFWDDLNGGRKWFRLMPIPIMLVVRVQMSNVCRRATRLRIRFNQARKRNRRRRRICLLHRNRHTRMRKNRSA